MVSSGQVNGDLGKFKGYMSSYSSKVESAFGKWVGSSFDSISNQTSDLITSLSAPVESMMGNFAAACDAYVEYCQIKKDLQTARANLANAYHKKDKVEIYMYKGETEYLNGKLSRKKAEIKALLGGGGGVPSGNGESPDLSLPNVELPEGLDIPIEFVHDGPLTPEEIEELISIGLGQRGLHKYKSMNYGPGSGKNGGFGCAMFVAYCFNNLLYGGVSGQDIDSEGFYGSCKNIYGNVTGGDIDPHNKYFVLVGEQGHLDNIQPGDVVCFVHDNDDDGNFFDSASNCFHVGLYIGDDDKGRPQIMHSSAYNPNGGVDITTINNYINNKVNNGSKDVQIPYTYYVLRYVGDNPDYEPDFPVYDPAEHDDDVRN